MADSKREARHRLICSAEAAFDETIALMMSDLEVADNKSETDKMLERMRDKIFSALLKVRLGWKDGKRLEATVRVAARRCLNRRCGMACNLCKGRSRRTN